MYKLLWVWQLPQYLLAKLLLLFVTVEERLLYEDSIVYTCKNTGWGISLGKYIIIDSRCSQNTIKHEYGHSLQSLRLGWLYLFVVGLPSIVMNILTRMRILKSEKYYKRWPESWADNLGKVRR